MSWQVSGQVIESCSCNLLCPCWFGVPDYAVMDQGYCASAIGFRLREGEVDGVDISGRLAVLGLYFPGPEMFGGNGVARLYVDDGANDDQRREIEAIFHGEKGGPMAALEPLIAQWLPTRTARMEDRDDGETITLTVSDAGEVRSQLLRDPGGQGFELRGGGFVSGFGTEAVAIAPTSSRWADPELPGSFETKSGARGDFRWSG